MLFFIQINLSFKSIYLSQKKKIHKSVYNQNTVGYQYKSSGRQGYVWASFIDSSEEDETDG
jgi:hypothetical protein